MTEPTLCQCGHDVSEHGVQGGNWLPGPCSVPDCPCLSFREDGDVLDDEDD
jgi:hypothetical protein